MPPTSLSTPPVPGDHIASYELLESIGLGGNATVFKASCPTHGVVAVKVLHPGKLTELDIKRFHREFQAMKALQHPNIIEVYKSGMHGSYPWMSMELVTGGDLSNKIENWNKDTSQRNTFVEITHTFGQLCLALEHLHNKGMIHRDLKPSNILLTEHNHVKLTDFGGVKAPHSFKTDLTMLGSLIGTVAFMAPEQILGEPVDQRTDLYALGAVLYMSLTGEKPFEAKTMAEYLAKHLNQEPPSAQLLRPEAPAHLAKLCTRLMQKTLPSAYNMPRLYTQRFTTNLLYIYSDLKRLYAVSKRGQPLITPVWFCSTDIKVWEPKHALSTLLNTIRNWAGKFTWATVFHQFPKKKDASCVRSNRKNTPYSLFSEIQQRVLKDEPLTILVNTVDKWKTFGQHLTVPKRPFALHPLSPHTNPTAVATIRLI